ncbi:hypothetical protein TIFTF001_017551 [Ficus carica]|uniref:Uncharacterized protein n=1 Tax=Ficus carica TaxID=3494 RepID=A0AA88ACF7_FICCA|nr:hypothetical protein TIFTF001_017551 [Ficus carica]
MITISSGTLQQAIWWPKDVLTQTCHRGGCRRRRQRARGAQDHEIKGNLNRDFDFLSILLSREVIFILEITIVLWCRRRWRSRQRRRRRSRRTEISTVACKVARDVKFLSPRRQRSASVDYAGDGPLAAR